MVSPSATLTECVTGRHVNTFVPLGELFSVFKLNNLTDGQVN